MSIVKKTPEGDVRVVKGSFKPGFVRKPHLDGMLADAYTILSSQLSELRHKAEEGAQLDREETRNFSTLVEALTRLAKEEREQRAADRLEELSDEELLAAAETAKKVLGGGKD